MVIISLQSHFSLCIRYVVFGCCRHVYISLILARTSITSRKNMLYWLRKQTGLSSLDVNPKKLLNLSV